VICAIPDALITVEDPLTTNYHIEIAEFAAKARLPAMYGLPGGSVRSAACDPVGDMQRSILL
jgi:hypothetical protein